MLTIQDLKFDEKGLIPAVVVDAKSRKVLTVAYMNAESLAISMEKSSPVSGAAPVRSCGSRVRPAATTSTL